MTQHGFDAHAFLFHNNVLCSLISVDSSPDACVVSTACAMTYLQLLWKLFEVFLEVWNYGILETRRSLLITGCQLSQVETQIMHLLFDPCWILLSSYVFKGVCVMWEADLSSNQTVRTQHPTPFYWLYCIQHFLYDTLANSLKFDCFISKYAHSTSIYSARWS